MPSIDVDEEAAKRLGALRIEDASSDEIVTELITNHEAEERTLFRAGDDT